MDIEIVRGGDTISPAIVNAYSVLSLPSYWRAINFLADNMASFDIDVYQNESIVEETHPLDRLFSRRANPQQSAYSFWHTWYFHGEHFGNGYAYIRRASVTSNDILGLYNLLPEEVTPFRLIHEGESVFDAQIYYWHEPSHLAFTADDILHNKGLAYDGLIGYSPTQMLSSTFRRAGQIERYQSKVLDKGTLIKGSIEFPTGTSKEVIAEVMSTLREFRASTGDRDIIILGGGAKLNNASLSPADTQLLEQDRESTKKIAQVTGVDPRFLFEKSEGKYSDNAEAAGTDVVRFTFRTRIERIENELTIKLLSEAEQDQGYSIELDADALLRGDTQTEMTVVGAGVNGGILKTNEGRARLGLPDDKDPASNELRQPTHLVAPKADAPETPDGK